MPNSEMELRPIRPELQWAKGVPFLVFPAAFLARSTGTETAILVGCIVAGATIVAVNYWLMFRNAKLRFDGSTIKYVDALGRTRTVGGAAGGKIVAVNVRSGGTTSWLLWIQPDGHVALRLAERAWPRQHVEAFTASAGYVLEPSEEPMSAHEASQRWPGAFPWPAREPSKFAAVFAVGLIALGILTTAL